MPPMQARPDLQLALSPHSPGFPAAIPDLWTYAEIVLRLRGDRPALAGYAFATLLVPGRAGATLDGLLERLPWSMHRIDVGAALLTGEDVLVELQARRRDAAACQLDVVARATTPAAARQLVDEIARALPGRVIEPPERFTVLWAFRGARDELIVEPVEEVYGARVVDTAYPTLTQGVTAFVEGFLDSPECVLVLQGPPGTGKTQLIRAIAATLTRRKGRSANVLYSNDERVLHSDEFFVRFVTGEADAMVLEDADHNLLARSRGNAELHRMLGVSDGIIRAQGRKMIFSTNLPNLTDLDDALVRPGRCHASLRLRALRGAEIAALLVGICADAAHVQRARVLLGESPSSGCTLAEIYRAARSSAPAPADQPSESVPLCAS